MFGWAVGEDDKNSSAHILQIDQGGETISQQYYKEIFQYLVIIYLGLTLPTRENYLNKTEQHDKILAALLDYMVKICMLLGAENEQDTRYQMKAIIEFETLLAKITTPNDDRQDEEKMYLVMKLSELQIKAPFINWQIHFADAFRLVGKKKINDEEKVVVYAIDYLTNLTSLIKNYTDTNDGKM